MQTGAQRRTEALDEELVRSFRESRDQSCFAELFIRHRKKVYYACRSFFSDGGAAEDATQEAFLRAYQNIDRFLGGDFCGWLMRIARNVCIDQWRKHRPEVGTEQVKEGELPEAVTLEHSMNLQLVAEKIRKEMQSLSPEQRRCLELKIEGYSYEETAARTGLPIEAVKSHLQNGRRMLWLKMEKTLAQSR